MKSYPFYRQHLQTDCGPTCLKIVSAFHGINLTQEFLEKHFDLASKSSLTRLSEVLTLIGFRNVMAKILPENLKGAVLPAIVFIQNSHFVVIFEVTEQFIVVADPLSSISKIPHRDFFFQWIGSDEKGIPGVVLLLEPTHMQGSLSFLPV